MENQSWEEKTPFLILKTGNLKNRARQFKQKICHIQ